MPEPANVTTRPARIADVERILGLVNELAVQQVMLPRSPASVIENVRDFHVAEIDGQFAGCGALAICWSDLAEVRSLAVHPDHQGHGIGRRLVDALTAEAEQLGVPKLFAFTYVPEFFSKVGFQETAHDRLPHKVFNDCLHCPKFMACDEVAMTRTLTIGDGPPDLLETPQTAFPLPRRTAAGRPSPGGRLAR